MQTNYISLNPANAAAEEAAIRSRLYNQRYEEAEGTKAASILGTQFGTTAALLTFSRMQTT